MAICVDDIGETARIFALFDPTQRLEVFHVTKIAAQARHFHKIPLYHVGHQIARVMAGSESFRTLLTTILENPTDIAARLQRFCNRFKKKSDEYRFNLADALWRRKHFRWYEHVVRLAVAQSPDSVGLLLQFGRLAALRGDEATLNVTMAGLEARDPTNPHIPAWWGDGARRVGRPDAALGHFERAAALAPSATHLQITISQLRQELATMVRKTNGCRDE
jgi:hypothetical protein